MSTLRDEIVALIRQEGPISIELYMALCLGHPRYGYYVSRDPLGAGGDFTTAPEISQIFGELLGLWAITVWQSMGAPERFRLIELGPGRGTLMEDALRAARSVGSFSAAIDLHLVETSPVLRKAQAERIARTGHTPSWHLTLDTVPDGPAIVIANEFFDALPIRQFVHAGGVWREKLVGLDEAGALCFALAPGPTEAMTVKARENDVLEINFAGLAVMEQLSRRLKAQGGAALIVDYGHAETSFGDTFQALQHHVFADPLAAPGEADLTAHVDFAALSRQARAAGATTYGPVTQNALLARLGARERAAMLMRHAGDAATRAGIDSGIERLMALGARQMGALFKAISVTAPGLPVPAGFETPDPLLAQSNPRGSKPR